MDIINCIVNDPEASFSNSIMQSPIDLFFTIVFFFRVENFEYDIGYLSDNFGWGYSLTSLFAPTPRFLQLCSFFFEPCTLSIISGTFWTTLVGGTP